MHRSLNYGANPSNDSRLHRRRHHYQSHKDKALDLANFLGDPSPSSPEQPASASSLRRQIAVSLMQHHRSIERNNHALQPVSPASYGSSMEIAPYNPAVTPSSLDFKGRIGESHYGLKTSRELLKVLNRIWSLEEQHESNISLIKALKTEVDHANLKIKELLRERSADRREVDNLMKQIAEGKLVRKNKEHDRIQAAVQSVREELEDERKLRKRSEGLHRKLARDLSETKSSLLNALKELEREKRSRTLLEDLCDEFASGIKEYEKEVHALKQKPDKYSSRVEHDRLILHISESWLDERMQMGHEDKSESIEKNSIVEKLRPEIESLLQTKRMMPGDRRTSLESVAFNEAVSAPQDVGDDEEGSLSSDSHCFELNKSNGNNLISHRDETVDSHVGESETTKLDDTKRKFAPHRRTKSNTPSNLQVNFEEHMAFAMSLMGNKKSQVVNAEQGKSEEGKPEETNKDGSYERAKQDEIHGSKSSHMFDNLIRSQLSLANGGSIHLEDDYKEASYSNSGWRNQASPVRQWMVKALDVDVSESSSKVPLSLKENTLKAKLLEARSKGHRSRLKVFRGSS